MKALLSFSHSPIRTSLVLWLGLLISVGTPVRVGAQTSDSGVTASGGHSHFRRNFAFVAFSGIGGAILGLSTLSFYGSPQDHAGNITTGFFLGISAGITYLLTRSETIVDGSTQLTEPPIDRLRYARGDDVATVPLWRINF